MLELGTDEFAKYPFLEGAGKILKDKGFPLSQFGTDPDLEPDSKFLHKVAFTNLILLMDKHQNLLFLKKRFSHFF
jgi:hypothetical protein